MHDKVFIAHAREDAAQAEQIFDFLKNSSAFKPWMDKMNLLPGQNWKEEINQALKSADFIILLLSSMAVSKTGYIQREFRMALDYVEERPEATIYIIPVLLDDCKVPERLAPFHWINFDEPDFYERVYKALQSQRNAYLLLESERIARDLSFGFEMKVLNESLGEKIVHEIEITYPQFKDTKKLSLIQLNTYILAEVYRQQNYFLAENQGDESNGNPYHPTNEFRTTYNLQLISPKLITMTIFHYFYTGGAHGQYATSGENYLLDPLIELDLEKLLSHNEQALQHLGELCKAKLCSMAREELEIEPEEFFLGDFDENVSWEFLGNFYIGMQTINVLFAPYQVAACAYGQHEVVIGFDEILEVFPGLDELKRLDEYLSTIER